MEIIRAPFKMSPQINADKEEWSVLESRSSYLMFMNEKNYTVDLGLYNLSDSIVYVNYPSLNSNTQKM